MKYKIGDKLIYKNNDTVYLNVRVLECYKNPNTYKLKGFNDVAFEDELYKTINLK